MRRVLTMSVAAAVCLSAVAATRNGRPAEAAGAASCAAGDAGITLPAGFCATIFADSIRGARQLAVAPNGDVFVAVEGGQGRPGGVVALRDANHDGKADVKHDFASGFTSSAIALFDGHLYAEHLPPRARGGAPGSAGPAISILRYPLAAGSLTPSGAPDTIVSGLPGAPGHSTRNFVISRAGVLYVNVGSPTNSCQSKDRAPYVRGENPCAELDTRAGIWKFDARKAHQTEATGVHFARGIRNAVGITLRPGDERLWTTQHGRDQLGDWRDSLHLDAAAANKYNAENPAEELMQVNQGDDFGWPYCYYSVEEHRLVLAPEYGGNGKKVAQCAQKKEPVATFPGHWAPNALFFYTGSNFPARYKNGAFIAFHGSWNRAPEPQAGFNVVFQPLRGNAASGKYEIFADGFAPHAGVATGAHRPTGLAQGPDGALYVSDDALGRIYKIVYTAK
jgi:glucose/arabinose dehydrogenase